MKKLFGLMKSRIEPYVGIGIVIVVVVLRLTDVKDELGDRIGEVDTKVDQVQAEVKTNKEAWRADDAADEKLFTTRFDQIQELGEELKTKQMVLEANLDGLRIASTAGAEERQAQLEGRLVVLQNQMMNMTISQQEYNETQREIKAQLDLIQELQNVRDTVIVVETDTLMVKKKGRWYWFD